MFWIWFHSITTDLAKLSHGLRPNPVLLYQAAQYKQQIWICQRVHILLTNIWFAYIFSAIQLPVLYPYKQTTDSQNSAYIITYTYTKIIGVETKFSSKCHK